MRTSNRTARLSAPAVSAALLCVCGATWLAPAASAEDFECLVEPYVEVKLSSAVPGILDEVLVDRGDVVRKGQALARLKSDAQKAHLDLVRARSEFATRKAERNEELYRKQMISPHEKDELETEAAILRLELREVEEELKLRTLTSPVDGVVVERLFTAGEFVSDEPIFELAQIDPLRVEAAVPVGLHGRIKVGSTATVTWEAPRLTPQQAKVTVVDPVVDAASGTIGVRLELANASRQLPAGTQCRVRFAGL